MMRVFFSVATIILTTISCSGGGGGNNGGDQLETKEQTIGAEGGEISIGEGKIKLTVPKGALSEDIDISLTEVNLGDLPEEFSDLSVLKYYELKPDGLEFSSPAEFSIETEVAPIFEENKLTLSNHFLFTSKAGNPKVLGKSKLTYSYDSNKVTTGVITGEVSHFSPIILAKGAFGGETDMLFALDHPTTMNVGQLYDISGTVTHKGGFSVEEGSATVAGEPLNLQVFGEIGSSSLVKKSFSEGSTLTLTGQAKCTALEGANVSYSAAIFDASMIRGDGFVALETDEDGYLNYIVINVRPDCTGEEDPEPLKVIAGTFETTPQPEGVFEVLAKLFALTDTSVSQGLVVTGYSGSRIHDLATGKVVQDYTDSSNTATYYGGIPGKNSYFAYGSTGAFNPVYDGGWLGGTLTFMSNNVTDAYPIFDSSGNILSALVVNNTLGDAYRMNVNSDRGYTVESSALVSSSTLSSNSILNLVSVYSPQGEGAFLGIGDGSPGTLFHASSTQSSPTITYVGNVGNSPRKIRCLDETGTPCLVSNYSSNSISILDWPTRTAVPTIRGATISVQGPVGVQVAKIGGKLRGLATGYGDNTLHIIDLDGASATDSVVNLVGCTQPGHATFVNEGSHIAITCNGNDKLQIIATP